MKLLGSIPLENMLLNILLPISLLGLAAASDVNINELADVVIKAINDVIHEERKNEQRVPTLDEKLSYKWGFIPYTVGLNCVNGNIKSLATLRRTGNAVLSDAPQKHTIKISLGLRNFEAYFQTCKAAVSELKGTLKQVKFSVDSNSVDAQISLNGAGAKCVAKIDRITVTKLGQISITDDSQWWSNVVKKALVSAMNRMHDKLRERASEIINKAAERALPQIKLCEMIQQTV